MSDEVCAYCGRRGGDICDEPPADICELAVEASFRRGPDREKLFNLPDFLTCGTRPGYQRTPVERLVWKWERPSVREEWRRDIEDAINHAIEQDRAKRNAT